MAPLWLRATLTIGPWQSMRMRSSRECHDDRRMSSVRPRCQRNARLGLSTDRPARWLRLLAKLTLHFAKLTRRRPDHFLWGGVAARGRAEFALGADPCLGHDCCPAPSPNSQI